MHSREVTAWIYSFLIVGLFVLTVLYAHNVKFTVTSVEKDCDTTETTYQFIDK